MKDHLVVRHFGPIKDLDIQINKLTLFIGTQGSGKSTISKLLTICRDMNWYLCILEEKEVLKPFFDFYIDEYFHPDTFIHYRNEINGVEITYNAGIFKCKINEYTKEESISIINYWIDSANDDLIIKSATKGQKLLNSTNTIDNKVIQANSRYILYIPAERNLIGNLSSALASIMLAKIPLSDSIIEYMSLFEKAKKEFPKYEIPFLGVSYERKDGKERISILNEDTDLPLNACSSGLQSVLPMIMVIDYALKVESFDSFVIEEPEQNLFPQNQCELLSFISSKQADNEKENRQFVITTHSPYLLSYLNVLMLAHKLYNNEEIKDEVASIVHPNRMVDPANVAVYNLDPEGEVYCKSLIAERTGMISVNSLDSASEYIGENYDKLYRLFLKTKRK